MTIEDDKGLMETWRERVKVLKRETYALYLAYRAGRVPWFARLWLVVVVGYALSPIDLIPDFIPILGYSGIIKFWRKLRLTSSFTGIYTEKIYLWTLCSSVCSIVTLGGRVAAL